MAIVRARFATSTRAVRQTSSSAYIKIHAIPQQRALHRDWYGPSTCQVLKESGATIGRQECVPASVWEMATEKSKKVLLWSILQMVKISAGRSHSMILFCNY